MKSAARTFKDLIVWQKAHQFVLEIYRFTRDFPADVRFGPASQIRRSVVSDSKLLNVCDEVGRLLNGCASAIPASNCKLLCS